VACLHVKRNSLVGVNLLVIYIGFSGRLNACTITRYRSMYGNIASLWQILKAIFVITLLFPYLLCRVQIWVCMLFLRPQERVMETVSLLGEVQWPARRLVV
jgi:hypothetical protein